MTLLSPQKVVPSEGIEADALIVEEARRHRHKRRLVEVVVVVTVLSVASIVLAVGGLGGKPSGVGPSGLGGLGSFASPGKRGSVAAVHLSAGADAVAVSSGSVWVGGLDVVQRIDPRTGRVLARVRTPGAGGYYSELAAGDSAIWATAEPALAGRRLLYRIDPATDKVTARIAIGGNLAGLAAGGGYVAVAVMNGGVVEVSAATDRVVRRLAISNNGSVAYGLGSFWLTEPEGTSLYQIDPKNGVIRTHTLGPTVFPPGYSTVAGGIAVAGGDIWVVFSIYPNAPIIAGFDLRNGHELRERVINRADMLIAADGSIFVLVNPRSSNPTLFYPIADTAQVIWLDSLSGRELGRFVINDLQPLDLAVGDGAVWVTDEIRSNLLRLRAG